MPRGKNTNVYLSCKGKITKKGGKPTGGCGMQNYKTRINKRTLEMKGTKKLEHMKYCSTCNTSTLHASGSEIKHSS